MLQQLQQAGGWGGNMQQAGYLLQDDDSMHIDITGTALAPQQQQQQQQQSSATASQLMVPTPTRTYRSPQSNRSYQSYAPAGMVSAATQPPPAPAVPALMQQLFAQIGMQQVANFMQQQQQQPHQ